MQQQSICEHYYYQYAIGYDQLSGSATVYQCCGHLYADHYGHPRWDVYIYTKRINPQRRQWRYYAIDEHPGHLYGYLYYSCVRRLCNSHSHYQCYHNPTTIGNLIIWPIDARPCLP